MKITVYRHKVFSGTDGMSVVAQGEATLATIEKYGGEPILESAREVDERELDPNGVVYRCPTCNAPLMIVDSSVRVGTGSVENASWRTGYLMNCATHGHWHRLEGGNFHKV